MMRLTFWKCCLFLLVCGSLGACKKIKLEDGTPKCIQAKIAAIEKEPTYNPPAEVWRWDVDGKTYYYFTSNCCDQFNELYNEDCVRICSPDGGFSGQGDGQCPQWTGTVQKTLIWHD